MTDNLILTFDLNLANLQLVPTRELRNPKFPWHTKLTMSLDRLSLPEYGRQHCIGKLHCGLDQIYPTEADSSFQGIAVSLATCRNSTVGFPVRTGRIDATEAGPSGVPAPDTDLETTLARFEAAGFDQSDTISAT